MADPIHRGLYEDTLGDFFRGFLVRPVAYAARLRRIFGWP